MGIGTSELLLIFLVVLLVFGAKRIPEIARGLGHGIREFKDATRDIQRELTVENDRAAYGRRTTPAYTVDRTPDGTPADVPQHLPSPVPAAPSSDAPGGV